MEKLCKSKEAGSMGFHDIGRFNQALLCKQAWRIWSQPDSLVAKILRGRYFSKSFFMDCGVGTRPSYIWRSILHGRELLQQGLVRKIGNGASTNVWAENWIIDTTPRPPMYRADSDIDLTLKVSDLFMDNTRRWNRELLFETFTDEDAERILSLKPRMEAQDSVEWGFTNNGFYSTRSGYKLTGELVKLNAGGPENDGTLFSISQF